MDARRSRSGRITIATVAEEAGVSVPTVSKVLNGRAQVGGDTRRRVQDAIEATGYRHRRRSRAARTGLVDFVISRLDTAWACELLRGAEQEADRQGARLVLTVTRDRAAGRAREWLTALAARRTDGVVLVSDHEQVPAAEVRKADPRLVVVDQVGGSPPDLPAIGTTNWAGGFAATEHLIGLGHRRIGMVTGPGGVGSSDDRLDGYRAALRRAGLPLDPMLVRPGDFGTESGRRGTAELLELDDPATAVFACCDQQARGAYDEAYRRGLRIPDDLSVVGFDDVELCEWMTPRLTTVRQPLARMAGLAVRSLLESDRRPAENGEPPLRLELATTLVVRDSTTPAALISPGPDHPPR